MTDKQSRPAREEYGYLCPVDSRWSDNDIYGHINNVVYYSYFDSTINRYLIDEGGLDIHQGGRLPGTVGGGAESGQTGQQFCALWIGSVWQRRRGKGHRFCCSRVCKP